MLPPHELKNKTFSKSMRGYTPVEVDEYIDFLIAKYTELYRENDELERKLKAAATRLDELRSDEDSIRSTLIDAKRAAGKIKADAEDRAEAIVRSAKSSCNTILRDFNEKIDVGRDILAELQRDAFALKQELFERYSEHIRFIEKLTEDFDEASIPEQSELRTAAVNAIKESIASTYSAPSSDTAAPDADASDNANFTAPDAPAPNTDGDSEVSLSETSMVPFPEADEQQKPVLREYDSSDMADALAQATAESDVLETVRTKVDIPTGASKPGLKDSVLELNKSYKETQNDVVNTPDSDVTDEMSYLDFVKSVTSKQADTSKDADFDLLFDDGKNKKKKK